MKTTLFIISILFCPLLIEAQTTDSKLFVKAYANYGFSLASSFKTSDYSTSYFDGGYTQKTNNKGLGKGASFGIGVGYIVNDFITLGLDLDKYSGSTGSTETNSVNGGGSVNNTILTIESDMFTLTPNATFKAISQPKFFIYNRIGVAFGIINKLEQEVKYEYIDYVNNTLSYTTNKHKYEGSMPIGFRSALGVQTKISDKIRFFTEVQFSHITYSPKERIMTGGEILEAGKTKPQPIDLDDIAVINRDTEFVDELTYEWNKPVNDKAPRQETKFRVPFTSLSIGAGLVYRF